MWPYVLLIILPVMVQRLKLRDGSIRIYKQNTKDSIAMPMFWCFLLTLLVLRHETVGIDLSTYKNIFESISLSSWSNALGRSAELAYSALNKTISVFTDNFRWVLITTAVLSVCFIAKAYIKYSEDTLLSIALFVTSSNFILLFSGLSR